MSKLVIIIGLLAAFFIIKHLIRSKSGFHSTNDNQNANDKPESLKYADTVQCGFCGTHIPEAGSYRSGDKFYCNEEHCKQDKA